MYNRMRMRIYKHIRMCIYTYAFTYTSILRYMRRHCCAFCLYGQRTTKDLAAFLVHGLGRRFSVLLGAYRVRARGSKLAWP